MRNLLALLSTGLALIIGPAAAQTPPVDEIVHRANKAAYYEGQDGRAQVEMTITDSQGRERNRRMTILRKDAASTDAIENGAYRSEQKFYVYFTRPADVNKMGFLVWKKLDTDDDRWLYLPALDLVKRIAASDKRTSFVGSDFYYEDVSGRDIDEDHHELIDTTDNYYVLKNTPRNPSSVEFAYFVMYIHKDTFIPVQVEYFDAQDNRYRIAKALAVDNIQGHTTVTKASMENLKTGSKTVMQYSSVEYDIGLPDDIFSERYLRNSTLDIHTSSRVS